MRWKIRRGLVPGLAAAAALTCGCGPSLRAVGSANQTLPDRGRTIRQSSGQADIVVQTVDVPWKSSQPTVAFHLVVTNRSGSVLLFDPARVTIEDSAGRLRHPIPPQKLVRSLVRAPVASVPRPIVLGRPVPHRDQERAHGDRRYSPYDGYSQSNCARREVLSPHRFYHAWGLSSSCEPDPHFARRRAGAFLARLLRSRELADNETISGYLVFSYPLETGARLELSIPVTRTVGAGSRPEPPDVRDEHETPLRFRFEYE